MSALGAIGVVFGGVLVFLIAVDKISRAIEKPPENTGDAVSSSPVPEDQHPGRAAFQDVSVLR